MRPPHNVVERTTYTILLRDYIKRSRRSRANGDDDTGHGVRPRPRRQLGDGAGGGEMTITMRSLGQNTHTFIFDDSKGV